MFDFFSRRPQSAPQSPDKRQGGYEFTAEVTHGFPTQPSAFDYDPVLEIAAIGTKNGCLRVFGAPGIELTGACEEDAAVLKVKFIPGKGLIAVLLDSWSISLFKLATLQNSKIGEVGLQLKFEYKPEIRAEITSWEFIQNKNVLLCGTDTADIFAISLDDFKVNEEGISHGHISAEIQSRTGYEKALGTVEAIGKFESKPNHVILGYSRGIACIYDLEDQSVGSIFKSKSSQLEALHWFEEEKAILAFQDGSLVTWDLTIEETESENQDIMYGPMPCKPITIIHKIKDLKVFHGGLPRASYGDKYSVTAMSVQDHAVFDFSSKVVDYRIIKTSTSDAGSLVVLCEEELVVIDLITPKWPSYSLPYLAPIHSSALTACTTVQVKPDILNRITELGKLESENLSNRPWPIKGGQRLAKSQNQTKKDDLENVLLTGHEDGSVNIWSLANNQMRHLAKINSMKYFNTDDYDEFPAEETEDWPPFRKVGLYDPYSDDPRLGVRRLDMCAKTGTVLIGGTAGQVIIFILSETAGDHLVPTKTIDLLEKQDDKVKWKGHEQLDVKTERHFEEAGYQAQCIMQCKPPGAITALALQANWGLVGLGTSHGYALLDYRQMSVILAKCTLESPDSQTDSGFARGKSFRQSLRQSMRRIRSSFRSKNRSYRGSGRRPKSVGHSKVDQANQKLREEDLGHKEVRIERRIPTVETANQMSIVKTMMFATTHVKDGLGISPTFWVGTASGTVCFFALTVPDYNHRQENAVECIYAKMMQMHHRAPIVNISIIDRNGPISVYDESSQSNTHQLIVTTEEQIKVYSLPKVQYRSKKFKLTALEGSLIRKAIFGRFSIQEKPFYSLMTLTNQGEIILFNLDSEKQIILDKRYECLDKENAMGLFYSNIMSDGQGLHLLSPTEFQRFSSNSRIPSTTPCRIGIAD